MRRTAIFRTLARPTGRPSLVALAALALGVSGAFGAPGGGVAAGNDPAGPLADEALSRIDRLIGAASCSADAQCRAAAIGARPCGGAERFRAWSKVGTDERQLEQWLGVYAKERRRWHEQSGRLSTCDVLPEPVVRCERSAGAQGRCVVSAAGRVR